MSPTTTFRPRTVDIQHLTFAGSLAMRLVGPASDTATVLLRGGQLVSWVNAEGRELLCSEPFPWGPVSQLRSGGLAVLFPHQEAPDALTYLRLTQNADWRVHDTWFHRGVPHLTLRLRSQEAVCPSWPYEFDCYLDMALNSPQLLVTLKVVNVGSSPMPFIASMQPCFSLKPAPAEGWVATSDAASIPDAEGLLELHCRGFQALSVWSPFMPQDGRGHGGRVCVEARTPGQVMELAPGMHWLGTQQLQWNAREEI